MEITDPATAPFVATVTATMVDCAAVNNGSTTGRVNLNGSAMGRSLSGIEVVVVVVGGGSVVVVGGSAGGGAPGARGAVVVVVGVVVGVGLGRVGGGVG